QSRTTVKILSGSMRLDLEVAMPDTIVHSPNSSTLAFFPTHNYMYNLRAALDHTTARHNSTRDHDKIQPPTLTEQKDAFLASRAHNDAKNKSSPTTHNSQLTTLYIPYSHS